MALLFATGFGLTTTVSDLFESANGTNTISAVGRNGGQGIRTGGDDGHRVVKNLGVNASTIVFGFAFNPSSIPGTRGIMGVQDTGTVQALMTIDNAGTVHLTGTASTFLMPINVFSYLEGKLVIHGSAGSWVIRLNGVEVLNETGLDTQVSANAFANQFVLGGFPGGSLPVTRYYDDLVVMDGTDGTATQGAPFNDFLGDIRVDELLPDGAGDSTDWTPSAGSNYQCVDETPRNDDTDYVASATVGHKDLYTFPDLSSATGVVKGVIVVPRWRKDDAGSRTLKAKVKHSTTEGDGPDRGMTTSYVYDYGAVFGVNPSTTADWTIAEVNAAQAGTEVVA